MMSAVTMVIKVTLPPVSWLKNCSSKEGLYPVLKPPTYCGIAEREYLGSLTLVHNKKADLNYDLQDTSRVPTLEFGLLQTLYQLSLTSYHIPGFPPEILILSEQPLHKLPVT